MIPIYSALATLLLGVFSPLWFGILLTPVRRLRSGARRLDATTVQTVPDAPVTIQKLRDHERCGDRVVVAHHLAAWSRELQRKIFQMLVFNSAVSFVLVVIFAVKNDAALQAPTATLADLGEQVAASWPFSIVLAGSLIEVLVIVKLVQDQAAKYASVIDGAPTLPR